MTHRAAVVRAAAGMVSLLALAVLPLSSALAVVPSAARVRAEIARSNVQAGRARPLALEVRLVGESGEAIASGRARLDPNGFARLELTLSDGRREIHERSPAGYVTTRDGRKVDRALSLLPPTQLLQAPTEAEVAAALLGIGGDPERVELGMSGDADCWVLGGRDPGPFEANRRPSHWFDLEDRRAVRIDDPTVARFRLGPPAAPPGAIAFPAWIDVESPGWPRRRLDIQRVEPADPAPRLRSP